MLSMPCIVIHTYIEDDVGGVVDIFSTVSLNWDPNVLYTYVWMYIHYYTPLI